MKPIETGVLELGQPLKDYIDHHLDVITESVWFHELVESKVNAQLKPFIAEFDKRYKEHKCKKSD